MDEIKELLTTLKEDMSCRHSVYTKGGAKERLKKLIELVENEQKELCAMENKIMHDKVNKTLYAPGHDAILDAPKVSQKIDWEEL